MKTIRLYTLTALFLLVSCNFISGQTPAESLASDASQFFNLWMVDRNPRGAERFLSDDAILGACVTPAEIDKGRTLSASQVRALFRKAMALTLQKLPSGKTIGDFLSGDARVVSDRDGTILRHTHEGAFAIYQINLSDHPEKNGYLCKSTTDKSFQDQISRPENLYLLTRVHVKDKFEPFIFISVWRNEKGGWRLLTFSVINDD